MSQKSHKPGERTPEEQEMLNRLDALLSDHFLLTKRETLKVRVKMLLLEAMRLGDKE